jgi:hypothetical protein
MVRRGGRGSGRDRRGRAARRVASRESREQHLPRPAGDRHGKVGRLQIADRMAVAIEDGRLDGHEIDACAEDRRLLPGREPGRGDRQREGGRQPPAQLPTV